MNRENILAVADAIEAAARPEAKPEIGFNMARYFAFLPDQTGHGCRTTACIAGWALLVRDGATRATVLDAGTVQTEARDWLGFSDEDDFAAQSLFGVGNGDEANGAITPAHAVAVLRHLAETGGVDWSVLPATPHLEERDSHG